MRRFIVAEVKGTITMDDGSTSEFRIGTDFGWSQWGATQDRLSEGVPVMEAMVQGFLDEQIPFASDNDPDEDEDDTRA